MNQFISSLTGKPYDVNIEAFLLSFLSPTSPGTNYWDSPTNANLTGLTEREILRISLQVSEILKFIELFPLLHNQQSSFLDVGTGNGLVPHLLSRILLEMNILGIDPFLHGGHHTSWQNSDLNKEIENCVHHFNQNASLKYTASLQAVNNYGEHCVYLHDYIAKHPDCKFDYVYCKAIEHVPDWISFAADLCSVVDEGGLLMIKHRSFYSYLGPHRYSTTGIPWGHCLLSDDDYREYSGSFHSNRNLDMDNFYFSSLSYPRMTNRELFDVVNKNGLELVSNVSSLPKYYSRQLELLPKYTSYLQDALTCHPSLTLDEMLSGTYTFVFRKIYQ